MFDLTLLLSNSDKYIVTMVIKVPLLGLLIRQTFLGDTGSSDTYASSITLALSAVIDCEIAVSSLFEVIVSINFP